MLPMLSNLLPDKMLKEVPWVKELYSRGIIVLTVVGKICGYLSRQSL